MNRIVVRRSSLSLRTVVITAITVIATALLGTAPAAAAANEFDPLSVIEERGLLASPQDLGAARSATPTTRQESDGYVPDITPVTHLAETEGRSDVADVYHGPHSSYGYVTTTTPRGTHAGYVVLNDASAPTDHQFEIGDENTELELQSDGSAIVKDEHGDIVNYVQAPWAIDANGRHLDTSYRVDGNVLLQHVDTSGAAFPVVADPEFGCGIGYCSIYFNQSETHDLATAGVAALGGAVAICGLGGPPAIAGCAAAAGAIEATAIYADNHNTCVGLFFSTATSVVGIPVWWNPFTHSGGHCW